MKRDRRELKIYDTCVIDASQGGLTYIDDYGRNIGLTIPFVQKIMQK